MKRGRGGKKGGGGGWGKDETGGGGQKGEMGRERKGAERGLTPA